eukprot:s7647_g1.t1
MTAAMTGNGMIAAIPPRNLELNSREATASFTPGSIVARAGCGAYFGESHTLNFSFALEGPCQDSDRAELRTLLRVAKWTPESTEYLTDNEAVATGFEKLLRGICKPWRDHNDLWAGLSAVLDERGNDLLCVSFVKGHASAEDISLGRASVKEALWNGAADRLAVAGAALHALPPSVLLRHQRQVTVTVLMSC